MSIHLIIYLSYVQQPFNGWKSFNLWNQIALLKHYVGKCVNLKSNMWFANVICMPDMLWMIAAMWLAVGMWMAVWMIEAMWLKKCIRWKVINICECQLIIFQWVLQTSVDIWQKMCIKDTFRCRVGSSSTHICR